MKRWAILLAALMLALACCGAAAEGKANWLETVLGDAAQALENNVGLDIGASQTGRRDKKELALLFIDGEIIEGGSYYNHVGTLEAIEELMYDTDNAALLVVFNTPGGGLYEADELHHTLSVYKEQTGRPVYAYMKQECCSGGVYAAMAADIIYASKMTITGSVGVYVETYSEAGLLEKLGIEREFITTGENKVSGYPTLTTDQRAIEQAMVDEGFEFFKEVIRQGRGLSDEQMAPFLDGRILTAMQAKELGLVDKVLYYDEAIEEMTRNLGGDITFMNITPQAEYGFEDMITSEIMKWIMP
ncbi:MAG: S49 family peptidase [Clostridia bacterium]|nr:S49 family peptidase [Clostridia bacterium]